MAPCARLISLLGGSEHPAASRIMSRAATRRIARKYSRVWCTMKSVALHDRPREKLQRVGDGGLGDNELLAIVLGHGISRTSALELANGVLASVGGLHGLARATADDLRRVPGIGAARASQLIAA